MPEAAVARVAAREAREVVTVGVVAVATVVEQCNSESQRIQGCPCHTAMATRKLQVCSRSHEYRRSWDNHLEDSPPRK